MNANFARREASRMESRGETETSRSASSRAATNFLGVDQEGQDNEEFSPSQRSRLQNVTYYLLPFLFGIILPVLLFHPISNTGAFKRLAPSSSMTFMPIFGHARGSLDDFFAGRKKTETYWSVDTSRFQHMTSDPKILYNYTPLAPEKYPAKTRNLLERFQCEGIGSVYLTAPPSFPTKPRKRSILLDDVLYCRNSGAVHTFSAGLLARSGAQLQFLPETEGKVGGIFMGNDWDSVAWRKPYNEYSVHTWVAYIDENSIGRKMSKAYFQGQEWFKAQSKEVIGRWKY